MRTRSRATRTDLRRAVDCLPRHTREAMLEGIANNPIIVGAYTNPDGICPMLAAHRAGGRTNFIAFAHAWDRFAFTTGGKGRARRATRRELLILRSYLEASLLDEDAPTGELAAARREHMELVRRRAEEASRQAEASRQSEARRRGRRAHDARPGDPDRATELADSPGWSWTRPVRRYDDYERVLRRLETLTEDQAASPALTG